MKKRNREKHLAKLEEMGVTEEEWEAEKKEKKRVKEEDRKSRRTANGGFTPTEETKAKISAILKGKHERGEIKKRDYAGPFRKGFRHSPATKEKIRQSLKKKWAEDPEYQEKMRATGRLSPDARAKISKTLKEKWQNPEFRAKMTDAIKHRSSSSSSSSDARRRERISQSIRKKWEDEGYRKKTLKGMEAYRETMGLTPRPARPARVKRERVVRKKKDGPVAPRVAGRKKKVVKKKVKRKEKDDDVMIVMASAVSLVDQEKRRAVAEEYKRQKAEEDALKEQIENEIVESVDEAVTGKKKPVVKRKGTMKKNDGDISVMREERRDLYDLLYGDEAEKKSSDGDDNYAAENDDDGDLLGDSSSFLRGIAKKYDDENLDEFDPYGLEDF